MTTRFQRFLMLVLTICAMLSWPMKSAAQGPRVSYDDWNSVLDRFVDADGLVDYDGLATDRRVLDRFIESVETTGPQTRPELFPAREDRLAYYINAYNAHVFAGVLELGPNADTVWGFTGTGYGFFVQMKIVVDGEKTSLKSLEDDIIRQGFQDPRIHAALNCASIGCPRLPRKAFAPATLDEQLDAEMRKFVAEERNCKIDRETETVFLSKIFDWFRSDFESWEARESGGALIDYINRYRSTDDPIPTSYRLEFFKYDKALNRQ